MNEHRTNSVEWEFCGSCERDEHFTLFGLDIHLCEWHLVPDVTAIVRDPWFDRLHEIAVYDLEKGPDRLRVAVGEFAEGVHCFYVMAN